MSYARRCYHSFLALMGLAILALILAYTYIRYGEEAFYEALGKMILKGKE